MEERFQPSSDDAKDKSLHPPPGAASSALATYVVQIPRDQIYRVPPPEHARIIEDHTRNSSTQKKGRRGIFCWLIVPAVLLAISIGIATYALRATLYDAKSPEFTVTGIQAKNLGVNARRPPEYDVTLEATNPNTRMSVSYEAGKEATLVFKNKKIGKGGLKSKVNQESGTAAVDVHVVLSGNGVSLEAGTKKSLNDGPSEKLMVLNFDVTVEIMSWVRNERKNLNISCEFKVRNSLTSKAKISSQECSAEL